MSSATSPIPAGSQPAPTQARPARQVALAALAGAVVAVVAALVVRAVALALGVDSSPRQLMPGPLVFFGAIGGAAGALGWHLISSRARDPRRTLGWAVPLVLVISVVPDVLLGLGGTAWSSVITLMLMRVAIAAVALPVYARLLPLRR